MDKRELTLKELQNECLLIMDDIHAFCKKEGITYSLAYGSLIGAVRHKGFIPWDDDMDIIMPRPDYEKFLSSYRSEKYELVSPRYPESYICFARVCDNKRTYVIDKFPWRKKESGLWIDIFPADGVNDNYQKLLEKVRILSEKRNRQLIYRTAKVKMKDREGLVGKLKLLVKKVIFCNVNIHNFNIKHFSTISEIPFGSTKHWSQLLTFGKLDHKEFNDINDFRNVQLADFEDRQYFVMEGYDKVLKNIYGDYMKLPDVEDRTPKDLGINMHVYWKNNK